MTNENQQKQPVKYAQQPVTLGRVVLYVMPNKTLRSAEVTGVGFYEEPSYIDLLVKANSRDNTGSHLVPVMTWNKFEVPWAPSQDLVPGTWHWPAGRG